MSIDLGDYNIFQQIGKFTIQNLQKMRIDRIPALRLSNHSTPREVRICHHKVSTEGLEQLSLS